MNLKLKYTHKEYVDKLKAINPKIKVLEEFKGVAKKILHRCSCGKEWMVIPFSLLNGNTKSCGLCFTFAEYLINSFGENALDKYWSKDNIIDPWKISYQANRPKIKIMCQEKDYHGSYDITCANFVNGRRCPYCNPTSGKSHPRDSIAQYIIDTYGENSLDKYWSFEKNKINPWEVCKGSDKRAYFKCNKVSYHEDYISRIADFYHGKGYCSQCGNRKVHLFDSVGTVYPKSITFWSNKNKKSPYEYSKMSGQKVLWKCDNNKHKDYNRTICDAVLFDDTPSAHS